MTTYIPSPSSAVAPSRCAPTTMTIEPIPSPRTMRIAAFGCPGLDDLSREVGFPVAVVAAVEDVAKHARRLSDTWYASGVAKSWDDWVLPFDFDNWRFQTWSHVPFDRRWFGRTNHPLAASLVDGTLALGLPAGVDARTYASSFRDGLVELRFEAIARRPSFVVKWHHSRRSSIPTSRYARASASDPTPTEVRDVVRLTPHDLPAIATVALATLGRSAGPGNVTAPSAFGL